MDIEIIEDNKKIISKKSIELWKNDPVFEKFYSIVERSFIKDRSTMIKNRDNLAGELNHIIKKVYEHGYYKGLRERGDKNEGKEFPINNWDSEKVYPKGSVID